MHFMSDKTNEYWARKLYCRTGLHYIVDTSRNGGSFSDKNANEVLSCPFDPPHIKQVCNDFKLFIDKKLLFRGSTQAGHGAVDKKADFLF